MQRLLLLSCIALLIAVPPAFAQENKTVSQLVEEEIANPNNKIPNKAIVLIYSNTGWSGAIQDGEYRSATREGFGNAKIPIDCGSGGIFSIAIQKSTDSGYLYLGVIQNGKLLKDVSTTAAYGVATVAGECNPGLGGGCLIATAAFGSEVEPQVQFLRGFRDNYIMSTVTGSSFMNVFNGWYYSFSPQVADFEREQPWMQAAVKAAIYPLLGILTVSETAHSLVPGEGGAIMAGIVASSMIGAVYLTPVILPISRKLNFSVKLAVLVIGISIAITTIGFIFTSETMVMIGSTAIVLASLGASSLLLAQVIHKFVFHK